MKKLALILCLIPAFAFASDAPTVTLTQEQVQRLIDAESSKAVANFLAQEKAASAKEVYEILTKAFAPKPVSPAKEP